MYFAVSGNGTTQYFRSFDEGSLFAYSLELPTVDSVLAYEFNALGDFAVRVVAEKNGCRSEASEPVTVSIKGVVADFSSSNTCIQKNRFNFRNTSDGVVNRIQWTFIDSNSRSLVSRPNFTFPRQGAFPVTMIVTENSSGCSDTATSMVCLSENVVPLESSKTAFDASPVVAWKWDFGNGLTSSDQNPEPFKYASPSNYTLALELEDIDGCKSGYTQRIRVARLPFLRIVPRNQKVCQGEAITLNALYKGSMLWSIQDVNGCDTCSMLKVKPMELLAMHGSPPTCLVASIATNLRALPPLPHFFRRMWFRIKVANHLQESGLPWIAVKKTC